MSSTMPTLSRPSSPRSRRAPPRRDQTSPTSPRGASGRLAGSGGGLVDLAVIARPVRLAELELLQLARGGPRQGVAHLHGRRALEVRQPRPAVLDQVGLCRRAWRPEHDEGLHGLAPLGVRYAYHGGLGYRRVLVQAVLDLDRADVLAAGDDDVLLPVRDHQVVAGFDVTLVAGVEPTAVQRLRRLIRLLPVASEHNVGPREYLAFLVRPDLHADGRHACPRLKPRALRRLQAIPLGDGAIDGQEGRGLGQPVDLNELPAKLRLDALDGLRGRRRSSDDDPHGTGTGTTRPEARQ